MTGFHADLSLLRTVQKTIMLSNLVCMLIIIDIARCSFMTVF